MTEITDKAIKYMNLYVHLIQSEINHAKLLQPTLLSKDTWALIVVSTKYHPQLTKEIIQNDKSDFEKPKNIENLFIRAVIDLRSIMKYLTNRYFIPYDVEQRMLTPPPENIIKYVYIDEDFCFLMMELDNENSDAN